MTTPADQNAPRFWRDHGELRREIHRLDDALEANELRGDAAGIAEFVAFFERKCRECFLREEERLRLLPEDERQRRCSALRAEQTWVQSQTERLEGLLARARDGQAAARDELWVEGQRFRLALACRLCRGEYGCASLTPVAGWP